MLPVLFSETIIETPTYFLLYLSAFFFGILLLSRLARSKSLSPVLAIDLGILLFISGFLGARLFHIFFEAFDYYLENPLAVLYFWQGGFVLYGGVLASVPVAIFVLKRRGQDLWTWADLLVTSFFLGLGIGRLGCLSAGCCYGSVTDWWWGIIFRKPEAAAPSHLVLHPTQILESLFAFGLCLTLIIWGRRTNLKPGFLALVGGGSYAVFRFFLEFLRGDKDRGLYLQDSISTSQIISILALATIVYLFWARLYKRGGWR
ncbi:MAG: prolipoprotein diacylglyceryl transferase [Bradymonadales bacterium]|nr:MAG: prolipoprotein diacylglyceryl transferase [Bradymonadales bacterium]